MLVFGNAILKPPASLSNVVEIAGFVDALVTDVVSVAVFSKIGLKSSTSFRL